MMFFRKFIRFFLPAVFVFFLFSCASVKNTETNGNKSSESAKKQDVSISKGKSEDSVKKTGKRASPPKVSEIPLYNFSENFLKIEAENMFYENFQLLEDERASNFFAIKLVNDSSSAVAKIKFPQGTYSGLANIFSPASNHSRFYICADDDSYLVYGSEPPIDKYELTTRSVVSFTLESPATVTVKIQQNDSKKIQKDGQNGMCIDYILFTKID